MSNRLSLLLLSLIVSVFFVACGGGGGGSTASTTTNTPTASTSTTYQAGVTIGDSGVLDIDATALTYKLTIKNSSFGLENKVFEGRITKKSDGSYGIVGSKYASIFVYDNYSLMTLRASPSDPYFAEYFRRNPTVTKTVYIPIFALNNAKLLRTVDEVTSNTASLEFRSVFMGSGVTGGATSYKAEATRGKITKVSDSVFTVSSCTNEGKSIKNPQLTNAVSGNCGSGSLEVKTYTYDSSSGAWLVTPIDPRYRSQVIRAYFVADTRANEVVGFIDTADSSKTSAGFSIATVVPINNSLPPPAAGIDYSITSYQLCSSDQNCADTDGEYGIYYNNAFRTSASATEVTDESRSGGRTCRQTSTDNSPANGFSQGVWGPLPTAGSDPCLNSQDRPDTIAISFGGSTLNGKFRMLGVAIGYDPTVTGPSQKITLLNISQN